MVTSKVGPLFNRPKMARSASEILQRCVIKQAASKETTAALVFLHGLGDTGHGWGEILEGMKVPHMKIICPTAPVTPVSLNGGMRMPSWFDVYDLGEGSKKYDEQGIEKAVADVHTLLESEALKGIDTSRIVIGGFSQGGALALASAYSYHTDFAGILALSCWIPPTMQPKLIENMKSNKSTPVLQCHGDIDPVVRYTVGCKTAEMLKSFNPKNHEFKTYRGLPHSSCDQEMEDVKTFISTVLTHGKL